MSVREMEKRIKDLEREVAELKRIIQKEKPQGSPWYIKNAGMFKDDPVFDDIVERGRKYRESLRPLTRYKSNRSE